MSTEGKDVTHKTISDAVKDPHSAFSKAAVEGFDKYLDEYERRAQTSNEQAQLATPAARRPRKRR